MKTNYPHIRRITTITLIASCGLSWPSYSASRKLYITRRGDTLSQIAADRIGRPIFTKDGSLSKLLRLNPQIGNPDRVGEGDEIYLGDNPVVAATDIDRRPASEESAPPTPSPSPSPDTEDNFSLAPAILPYPVASTAPMSPQVAPQPAPLAESPDPISQLGIDLGFEYFKINSKDKTSGGSATLLSNTSPALRATWDLAWTDQWTSRLRLNYLYESVINATNSSSSIQNGSGSRIGFELGVLHNWNAASVTEFFVGSTQRIFAVSTSASTINIERVHEPEFGAHHEQDLFKVKSATAGIGLGLAALGGGSGTGYSTRLGWDAQTSAYVRHRLTQSNLELRGEVFYGTWSQNSDLVKEREQDLGMFFGLSKRLGE